MNGRPEARARGVRVLREAVVLLSEMTFDASMGDAARGAWVSVFIAPRRDDSEMITVDISCRPAWPQSVDWDTLALWVRPARFAGDGAAAAQSDRSFGLLPPLDERGFVSFSGLPAGLYSIGVGERAARRLLVLPSMGSSVTPGSGEQRVARTRGRLAPRGMREDPVNAGDTELRLRVARRREREGPGGTVEFPLSGLQVYRSVHRRITATVLPGVETMEIAFETDDQDLAGRRLRFCFIYADTGRVASSGDVTFRAVPDAAHLWEAVWLGPLVTETADFVYELL
jgi:hypothetical protein